MAPLLLTPRLLQTAQSRSTTPALASASALALGHGYMPPIRFPGGLTRRTTSTSLRILEVAPSLLTIPVPDAEPASSGSVSLLRGFQATVPSADTGKERRRKLRGSLADSGIGGSVGVRRIAAKEGVLGGGGGEAAADNDGEILNPKERRRRRRETAAHDHSTKGRDIDAEELVRMQDEIKWDRENLVVRKVCASRSLFACAASPTRRLTTPALACVFARQSLLNSEIQEVSGKIAALETIRSELEQGILKLREEDLELVEECASSRSACPAPARPSPQLTTDDPLDVRFARPQLRTSRSACRASRPTACRACSTSARPSRARTAGARARPSSRLSTTTCRRASPSWSVPSYRASCLPCTSRRCATLTVATSRCPPPPSFAIQTLANHTGRITALDFTEPYGTLVSAAADETVRVWDLCSGEEVGRLRGHKGAFVVGRSLRSEVIGSLIDRSPLGLTPLPPQAWSRRSRRTTSCA